MACSSITESTGTKLSNVSTHRIDGSDNKAFVGLDVMNADLIRSILLLKWSAKISHCESVVLPLVISVLGLIRRSIVEKRILWLFLLAEMSFVKWSFLDCFNALL